ncbi:MAG: YIP1 family protein [Candidatus Altiarchaeia archaeon]
MSQIERIKRVLMLDRKVYKEIRDDSGSMAPALTVMVVSILIGSIRTLIEMPQGGIITLMSLVLLWFVPSSFFHVLSKLAGGRSDYGGYLRATGYAQIPMAANIIPSIGWPLALSWWLVCMTVATRQAQELSKRRAVLVVFIPFVLTAVLISAMIASEAI